MGVGGCGDFFAEKSTELEADRTIQSLTQIKPVAEPNISVPEIYKAPPKIIKQIISGTEEWKLFYFCKYHTAEHLRNIIYAQFATQLFNKRGQATTVKDYTITANPATNQLIVRGPTEQDIQAILQLLEMVDVPPIQVKIDCIVSELYADVTMDRETTIKIQNLLGEHITLGGKEENGELLPAFPGAALRDIARSKFGLKIGYVKGKEGHILKTLIDILESKGYLKILMNPSLEVVNGQTARIRAQEHVPLQQVYLRDLRSEFIETRTEYVDVIDELQITPRVFADGSIGLETRALIGAKSTPEGVKQIPVVTEREIQNKENRIRPGESLVIGGIRKTERRAVVRGVPFLKDIPLLGLLFSSKDFEERAKETIFIITPTISTGGIPSKEMTARLRKQHEPPIPPETLHDAIADPFGFRARERQQQRELLDAERARLEAEREKAVARSAVRAADQKAQRAEAEAAREQAKAAAEKATTNAAALKAQAEKLAAEAQKAKAEAEAKAAQAQKALAEAQAKLEAAQKALEEAKKDGQGAQPDQGPQTPSRPKPPTNEDNAKQQPPKDDSKSQEPQQPAKNAAPTGKKTQPSTQQSDQSGQPKSQKPAEASKNQAENTNNPPQQK